MKLTVHRFLWVNLQIESLCDNRRIKLEEDLVDELARLPQSLAGMYSVILGNIGRIEQRGRTVAKTMFKWLLCTDDASSEVTLAACSGTASTECRSLSVSDVLDVCSNLVVYDKPVDTFRFAHLSVREFLESQPGYTLFEANKSVCEKALRTLTRNQTPRDHFWSYATVHWVFHYHRLGEQHRKKLFEHTAKLFLFNGAKSSDTFNVWTTEFYKQNNPLVRSSDLYRDRESYQSPINLASFFGWLEILDHFWTNQTTNGFYDAATTMMTVAIRSGQTSVVRWLFDRGVCPAYYHLAQAFHYLRSEIIEGLLDTGMDLSAEDDLETLLSLSPRSNDPTLNSGVDLPGHILQSRECHIACLFLHYGLDVISEDIDMRTEWTETLTMIGRLPKAACDISVSEETRPQKLSNILKDQSHLVGQTLLSLAALFRHEKAFQMLLDWGVDPTCPAIAEKRSAVSQTFKSMSRLKPLALKRKSNIDRLSDELRQGPLAWAAYTGNVPLVQSILDRGMNPSIQNRKGQTALYFAVQQTENMYLRQNLETDKDEIVRLLLQRGAIVAPADIMVELPS